MTARRRSGQFSKKKAESTTRRPRSLFGQTPLSSRRARKQFLALSTTLANIFSNAVNRAQSGRPVCSWSSTRSWWSISSHQQEGKNICPANATFSRSWRKSDQEMTRFHQKNLSAIQHRWPKKRYTSSSMIAYLAKGKLNTATKARKGVAWFVQLTSLPRSRSREMLSISAQKTKIYATRLKQKESGWRLRCNHNEYSFRLNLQRYYPQKFIIKLILFFN